jgi:hypothetical protein
MTQTQNGVGRALAVGVLVGLVIGACGPTKTDGPTALVVKVLLNQNRGTRILFIRGVDSTPVDLFPGQYRPEQPLPAQMPTGQTFRILLDDSAAGTPFDLTVVGLDADNVPIEAATMVVTAVARQETSVTIKLALYEEPDAGAGGGGGAGGGVAAGGGGGAAGGGGGTAGCRCATGCCDVSGECAVSDGGVKAKLVFVGPVGGECRGICPLQLADRYSVDAGCQCGNEGVCGTGLRCSSGHCVCDRSSNCPGCCVGASMCALTGSNTGGTMQCGAGGIQCQNCGGGQTPPVCSISGTCGACTASTDQCCSGRDKAEVAFPTCRQVDGACEACDLARSDRCVQPVLATKFSGCSCGPNGGLCPSRQACVNGACVPLPALLTK